MLFVWWKSYGNKGKINYEKLWGDVEFSNNAKLFNITLLNLIKEIRIMLQKENSKANLMQFVL